MPPLRAILATVPQPFPTSQLRISRMTPATSLNLLVRIESFPIAGSFTIARGAKTEAVVVVAEVSDGVHRGIGECVPYPRYNETADATHAALVAMTDALKRGLTIQELQTLMPAGAARNALDCALWD